MLPGFFVPPVTVRGRHVDSTIVVGVLALAAGVGLGYLIRRNLASGKLAGAEREAEKLRARTRTARPRRSSRRPSSRPRKRSTRSAARSRTELRDRRDELAGAEQRMMQREEQLEARALEQDRRDQSLRDREANIAEAHRRARGSARDEAVATLERISGMSTAQAREMLLKQTEDDARHDMAKLVRQVEEEARREADRRARNMLSL